MQEVQLPQSFFHIILNSFRRNKTGLIKIIAILSPKTSHESYNIAGFSNISINRLERHAQCSEAPLRENI